MTKQRSDFEDWLSEQETSATRCKTCHNPEWCDTIQGFLRDRAEGKHSHTIEMLYRFLRERRNYTLSLNTLYRHARVCEGELYARARIR